MNIIKGLEMIDYSRFSKVTKNRIDTPLKYTSQNDNIKSLKDAVIKDLEIIHDMIVSDASFNSIITLIMEINIKFTNVSENLKLSKQFSISPDASYRLNEISKLILACREDIKSNAMVRMNEANNAL
ncbi:hypothetical protein CL621_01050 [archaeon]|nr:hypothetical protein [archaeon]